MKMHFIDIFARLKPRAPPGTARLGARSQPGELQHQRDPGQHIQKIGPLASGEMQYPSKSRTAIILSCVYIAVFLMSLDRTILGTAIPRITDDFKSINDIGWYNSAFTLTACSFIFVYCRLYTFWSAKWVLLSGIFFFEIGSAICGAAHSSPVFILGRAVSGLGASSVLAGAIVVVSHVVPVPKRPIYFSLFGAVASLGMIVGPLLGGVFTRLASWRWCFFINLPFGAATMAGLAIFLEMKEAQKSPTNWRQRVIQLDPLGIWILVTSIVCLLLALQWGGTIYSWSSWRIILLLSVFSIGVFSFVVQQSWPRATQAIIPFRVLKQRSVLFGTLFTFWTFASVTIALIYLPIWFQAIKGVSALRSGIMTLPLVISFVIGSLLSGALTQRLGYYTPFFYLSSVMMSIGAGLFTTFTPETSHNKWIGYQVLFGLGFGLAMQHPNLAVQMCLERKDLFVGAALIAFSQYLAGTVFLSVGQNLFFDRFTAKLQRLPKEVIEPSSIAHTGAANFRDIIPSQYLAEVVEAYNDALTHGTFIAALVMACMSIIGAAGMEWRNVKKSGSKAPVKTTTSQEHLEAGEAGEAGEAVELEEIKEADNKEEEVCMGHDDIR